MSHMVRMFLENCESAIELFQQNHTSQFVRERQLSHGQREVGLAARLIGESVAGADGEEERDGRQLLALDKRGQFLRRKLFTPCIEENQFMTVVFLLSLLPPIATG